MDSLFILILKTSVPIFTGLFAWYLWSLSQKFTSRKEFENLKNKLLLKEEFSKFKEKYYNNAIKLDDKFTKQNKYLEHELNKQNQAIVELNVNMQNIFNTLTEIKEYLFQSRKNKH